ncbi:hypothetical protein WJX82_008452 [Trebouxia sp. C0006]
MARTLGPVALKLGDEVLVKDAEGFDVTAHYLQDLLEGEYSIKQPAAGQADLQTKMTYVHDVIKRREAQDQTVKMLFNERVEDEFHRIEITGKPDIALQHTAVEPGGFILEDTFLLVEAKKDLSTEALKAAEAKAYMQYVAFESATHRYVPVLLTDGNTMIFYVHNTKISAHQRMYWGFHQILDASIYLGELVKQIALSNPLTRSYIPGQDDQPASPEDPGTERGGPSTDRAELSRDLDEGEHDVKGTPMTNAKEHRDTSRPARSMLLEHASTWSIEHKDSLIEFCRVPDPAALIDEAVVDSSTQLPYASQVTLWEGSVA